MFVLGHPTYLCFIRVGSFGQADLAILIIYMGDITSKKTRYLYLQYIKIIQAI